MEIHRLETPKTKLPAAEHAYRSIRAAIVSGHLEEGERLIEERLSEDLGLSRTPVREAIRRLTQEGFIERHGGYNTRVATFPADEMEQTFHIGRCWNPMLPNARRGWLRTKTSPVSGHLVI